MGITDGCEMMSLAAARTAYQIGKPAGIICRWTPARTSSGAPAVVGVIYLQDVRLVRWPDGRWIAGQRQDGIGRQGWWYHLANAASLADAHAAAWRILAPRDAADGVLAQLAAEGVPMAPGWRS